jgi:polar amino acid transport system substrate-binding protein
VGDDGEFTGFDLDLAAEVAKRNDWKVEYKPINWDAKDLELTSGAIDCIWNGFTIEGREEGYTWTEPYMDNSQVIVVKKDSGITDLAGLKGKTVITQADSAAFHLLSPEGDQEELAATFKALQTTPEYNSAFLELESGAVDAIAIDLPVAKFQTQGKDDTYTILDEALTSEHYGVGFLKGNTSLRDKVQKTLKEMVADGTVETIADTYADQGISYDQWILEP